jgi:hypothetical protein
MTPAEYIASVLSEFTTSKLIASFDVVEQVAIIGARITPNIQRR